MGQDLVEKRNARHRTLVAVRLVLSSWPAHICFIKAHTEERDATILVTYASPIARGAGAQGGDG